MLIYDPKTRLSKHFTMKEVGRSDTADRFGIDNTPTPDILQAAQLVAENVLEPVRIHFGIPFSPSSWYRGEDLEKAITKVAFEKWARDRAMDPAKDSTWESYFEKKSHPRGEAVDFEIPGVPNDDVFLWIKNNIPVFDQLIREFRKPGIPDSGWIHVSYSATKNRRQVFEIN
jgi:zinc D-Ala-D-Ala carboxypeptidase